MVKSHKILLLDDDFDRVKMFQNRILELNWKNNYVTELIHTQHAHDCINMIDMILCENESFDYILLDHDLDGRVYVDISETNTGSEVARWINSNMNKIYNSSVITHTLNEVGANNILKLIPRAIYMPALWIQSRFHHIIQ